MASLLSLYLYPRLSDDSVSFTSFGLFMGASMSITAFPVLARILTERNMLQSRLGTIAITCAAVDDVTGWCILAYIVALVHSAHAATSLWFMVARIAVFTLIMIFGVKRLLRRFEVIYREQSTLNEDLLGLILLLVLVSALCTEWLGIHLLFGAFLMGVIMPKEQQFVRYILDRFETVTVGLLLPLFFAFTGLRTSIGLVKGPEMWFYCGLIIVIATASKLGGSMLASTLTGISLREAAGLGTLMNTRGLMELVVLNIGLDIKVISPALFSMMVIMALVTTSMTTPVLEMIYPRRLMLTPSNKTADEQAAVA
jgi:Kef-type K+ transport system membrane component KefB